MKPPLSPPLTAISDGIESDSEEKRIELRCPHCGQLIGSFTAKKLTLSLNVSTRNKFVGDCNKCSKVVRWYPQYQPQKNS